MPKPSYFSTYLTKLKKHYWKHFNVPTFVNAMNLLNVRSKSVIHRFYQQLVEQGYLVKNYGVYEATELLGELPIFESIQAGFPGTEKDVIKQGINLQTHLIDNPNTTMILKVRGDSMINAGIYQGDMVIVNRSKRHKEGDIVVAEVDSEFTLKYLRQDHQKKFFLEAGNNKYPPIYPEGEMLIHGVVTGSFRTYT